MPQTIMLGLYKWEIVAWNCSTKIENSSIKIKLFNKYL